MEHTVSLEINHYKKIQRWLKEDINLSVPNTCTNKELHIWGMLKTNYVVGKICICIY